MDSFDRAYQEAFDAAAIGGAVMVGLVLAAITMLVGALRGRIIMAFMGSALVFISCFFCGALGGIPMMGLMIWCMPKKHIAELNSEKRNPFEK